jgi:eukaryotic-like serine/threonine-protein kinase
MKGTLGRYQLLKRLAIGGMGEVWLAKQSGPVGFEKQLVVKTLRKHLKEDQEFVNMFFDEARIAAALTHPNIAQIYELGEANGEYFIAMEYVHGPSLKDMADFAAETETPVPLALKCRVIADAAGALDFAHQAKTPSGQALDLIHRDVSPQNILIGFNGAVKLIDFGVAKAANKLVRTATGVIKGKYAYMSPEQAYGQKLDGRSDVFGLGTVFWELLTGERLFKRETDTETLKAVVGLELVPPSRLDRAVPKALDAVVMRALERNVAGRFQSAGELRMAIETFLTRARLPATGAHLTAYMHQLFPEEGEPEPQQTEVTASTEGPAAPAALEQELEVRIAGVGPRDVTRGMFFSALFSAVKHSLGPLAELEVRRVVKDFKRCVDSLDYPTSSFLTALWKAVELMSPQHRSMDEAFEEVGAAMMDALLASTFGSGLFALKSLSPESLYQPLLETLGPMMTPGIRRVASAGPKSVRLVFKEEVLPIQLFAGLFRSLTHRLHGILPDWKWEKTAAERFELTLSWG